MRPTETRNKSLMNLNKLFIIIVGELIQYYHLISLDDLMNVNAHKELFHEQCLYGY